MGHLDIVAIGDLHLDALTKHHPGAIQYQLQDAARACDYAIDHHIEHVMLLGDTSHFTRLSETSWLAFLDFLKAYDGRLNIHCIMGNHDFLHTGASALRTFIRMEKHGAFSTVRFYDKPELVEVQGVKLHMCPFPHKTSAKGATNFGHFDVRGSTLDNGTPSRSKTSVKGHWINGHLHIHHKVGSVYFPGTLYQVNFGERLPKGFGRFRLSDEGSYTARWVQVKPTLLLTELQVGAYKDLSPVLKAGPSELFKINVVGDYVLPSNFLNDHEAVRYVTGYSGLTVSVKSDDGVEISSSSELSLTTGLTRFFKRKGMSSEMSKLARREVNDFLKGTG